MKKNNRGGGGGLRLYRIEVCNSLYCRMEKYSCWSKPQRKIFTLISITDMTGGGGVPFERFSPL